MLTNTQQINHSKNLKKIEKLKNELIELLKNDKDIYSKYKKYFNQIEFETKNLKNQNIDILNLKL